MFDTTSTTNFYDKETPFKFASENKTYRNKPNKTRSNRAIRVLKKRGFNF